MTYGTHRLGAVALGTVLGYAALPRWGWVGAVVIAIVTTIGGVWPDVDVAGSAASRRHPLLRALWCMTLLVVARSARRLQGHRTLSHSIFGIVLSLLVFAGAIHAAAAVADAFLGRTAVPHFQGLLLPALGALCAGMLLHVTMDGCTQSGVPLWLPVTTRRVRLAPEALRVRMDTTYFAERGGRARGR